MFYVLVDANEWSGATEPTPRGFHLDAYVERKRTGRSRAADIRSSIVRHLHHCVVDRPWRSRANQIWFGSESEVIRLQHLDEGAHVIAIQPLDSRFGDAPMRRNEGGRFTLASKPVCDIDSHDQLQ